MGFVSMFEELRMRSKRNSRSPLNYRLMAYSNTLTKFADKVHRKDGKIYIAFYFTPEVMQKAKLKVGDRVKLFFEPTTKEGYFEFDLEGERVLALATKKVQTAKVTYPYFEELGFPLVNAITSIDDTVKTTKGKIVFSLANLTHIK